MDHKESNDGCTTYYYNASYFIIFIHGMRDRLFLVLEGLNEKKFEISWYTIYIVNIHVFIVTFRFHEPVSFDLLHLHNIVNRINTYRV